MRLSRLDPAWATRLAVVAMLAAMAVFGSNFAIGRYGVQHGLTAYDIVFLRTVVPAPLLLPVFLRDGLRRPLRIGWGRAAILCCLSGAPMTLVMNLGVTFAPAAHGAALGPGTVTAVGVVYGLVVAGAWPPRATRWGLALVVAGLATVAGAGGASGTPSIVLGDLLFFVTGLLWGFYPIALHRWRLDGIGGAAACAVMSLAYAPIYLTVLEPRLLAVDPWLVVGMTVFQGLVSSIVALWLWGFGVRVLGPSGTQLFPPLIPVIGTAAAVPILGEWPGPAQAAGIGLIVAGLGFAAFGNRPRAG